MHDAVGREKKGRPKKSRADREQVAYVSRFGVIGRGKLAVVERSRLREKKIGMQPVLLEMETVLNQRRAGIGVISNAITMNDGIDQGK